MVVERLRVKPEKTEAELEKQLSRAKEDVIQDYCDSNVLVKELDGSFTDGFDDCFCQVKTSFWDLDLSHISIDTQAQIPARLVDSEGTDKLFADDSALDPQGDRETAYND